MSIKIYDADLAFNDNHTDREGAPKGIVLHHAATNGDVRDIHRYHRNENGWAGIGYHFYVTKDGVIWRGRPEQWLGAHTVGFNDRIGICAEGNYEEDSMPSVQQAAVMQLILYLKERYGDLQVTRHSDHDATACPGKNYPFEAVVKQSMQETASKENAVQMFQRAAMADGLALEQYGDDGVWGPETANAAAVVVRNGDRGERVRLVQSLLMAKGYDVGDTGADGIFGDMTEKAVTAYQGRNGLAVDGDIGIQTWMSLIEVTA